MKKVFEKIIEKLEETKKLGTKHYEDGKYIYTSPDYDHETLKNAIEIVKQTAEEFTTDTNVESNEWIPCSEPPETGVYVLLSFSNFSVPTVGRYEEDEKGGAYYIGDEEETCIQQDMFVNAWKPLPEPYKPKGE